MCTSYTIFKCLFAQVVAFSNSTTCELQGQKNKILLPCIFTGNTWIYHQMVMFLLKASYLPSFKKKLYFTLWGSGSAKHVRAGGQGGGCEPLSSGQDVAVAIRMVTLTTTVITCRPAEDQAWQHSVMYRKGPHEALWRLEGLGAIHGLWEKKVPFLLWCRH